MRVSATASQFGLWNEPRAAFRSTNPVLQQLSGLKDLGFPSNVMEKLREISWAFTQDDTSYLGHNLHPYPAKFIPQIPANLIVALSLPGERVWDPFGGSGTTALEALLLGRNAISTDANPVATLITKSKCTALSPEERFDLNSLAARMRTLERTHEVGTFLSGIAEKTAHNVPAVPNLLGWFSESSIEELSFIREEIEGVTNPAARTFALVAFSSIILAASYQDGETRYARRVRTLPPGRVLGLFATALESSLGAHDHLEALLGYRRALIESADILGPDCESIVEPESIDLIVTSPPYANSTDYHLYHRFRLFWLGYDPRGLARCEIGSHLRHQRKGEGYDLYTKEMSTALARMFTRLRPGRYAALVLGDSVFEGKTISTCDATMHIAAELGYETVGFVSREVHPTRRSFIPPARRTKSEQILILRKAPAALVLSFRPPPYRLWPYEKELRRREIMDLLHVKPSEQADGTLLAKLDCYDIDKARRLTFTHWVDGGPGNPRWQTWQQLLENGEAKSARKDPKYLTHGIHAYKGKFYPQLAKSLLNLADLTQGSKVLDPFCGSGTVLVESQLSGFRATGVDMNPLAVLISKAKVAVATESPVILDRLFKDFLDRIAHDRSSEANLEFFNQHVRFEVESWFPLPVAYRLGWLMGIIQRVPHPTVNLVLQVLLSSTIRQVSQQEPKDLRIRRRKKALYDAPILELFRARIGSFRQRLKHFGERMCCAPVALTRGEVVLGDSRLTETFQELNTHSFDCVVTSPPYATALPYIDTDRLSLLVLFGLDSTTRARIEERLTGSREIRERERRGLEESVRDNLDARLGSPSAAEVVRKIYVLNKCSGVGFRRRNMAALLIRYFSDMWATFRNLSAVVRAGAHMFFVIGDNKTLAGGRSVRIPSTESLAEMGKAVGWRVQERIPISVTREAPLHSRHAITENVVLHFRCPPHN